MKRTIIWLIILTIGSLLLSCKHTSTECSGILKEEVLVRDLVYTPATHGSSIGPTFGFNDSGDLGMGLAVTSVSTQEKFAIVFECPHGSFIIEREDLWKKLHENKSYTCLYRELYRTTYDGEEFIERVLLDYDFLGLAEFPELVQDDWQGKEK